MPESYCYNPRPDAHISIINPHHAEYKQIKDTIIKVVCEVCFEHISNVRIGDLSYPITGSMFRTPDEFHQVAPPFYPNFMWLELQCPHCGKRPFTYNNAIPTATAYYILMPHEGAIDIQYNHPATRYKKAIRISKPVEEAIGDVAGALLQTETPEFNEAYQLRRAGIVEEEKDNG